MILAELTAEGWAIIIASIFGGLTTLFGMWITYKLRSVRGEVVAVKKNVKEYKEETENARKEAKTQVEEVSRQVEEFKGKAKS